jgi:hypothetical protein
MDRKKLYFGALVIFAIVLAFSSDSILGLVAKANGYYLEISAGSPLNENWTDTSRINADDNWSNVVAIEAFTGGNLSPTPGTDPRTIVADNPAGTLAVKANETNPATSTADGVAEFHLVNPTVALKGSNTATAPNLVIHLNTTIGCVGKSVVIYFRARDIDDSANNAVSQVITQYRIGGTGNYTSINGSYIADATTGPSQATLVTHQWVTLPLTATGQPKVDVRILTTNAVGTDEWVGIDDIKVDCAYPTSATSSISGRVIDSAGRGISKAQVSILNTITGETKTIVTNPFGVYNFEENEVGNFYILTVTHKRYDFKQNTQSFQLMDDMENVNFIAN